MFFLDRGIDSGEIIDQKKFDISESDYIGHLVKNRKSFS